MSHIARSVRWAVVEYLTEAWFVAANAALAELTLGSGSLVLEQRVVDAATPARYQLVIAEGSAHLDRSGTHTPDVVLSQSLDTAAAVRDGSLNALAAVQDGHISIEGDPQRLIDCAGLLAEVDRRLARLNV